MKRTWMTGRLQGATQLAAALCLSATPALAQEDSLGYPAEEEAAPADGTVSDDMGTDESEEAGIEDEPSAADEPLGTLEPSGSEAAPPSPAETEPAEELAPAPDAATEGVETEGVEMEGAEIEAAPGEEPVEGEQGAMLPGGLDEMGTGEAELQASYEGEVRSVDLNDGTVELETESEGTVSLRGDSAQLEQLEPGQMVSVTYEDRSDGRWISEIQEPAAMEPAAEESEQNVEPDQAESVQQPQGKNMNEGYGGDASAMTEEEKAEKKAMKAEKRAEKKAREEAEQETSAQEEQAPEEKAADEKSAQDKALEAEAEAPTEPALEETAEQPAAEEGEHADEQAHEGEKAEEAEHAAEPQAEQPEAETEPAEEQAPAEATKKEQAKKGQAKKDQAKKDQARQARQEQATRPMPMMSTGAEPKAFEAGDDPAGLGPTSDVAPSFARSPSSEEVAAQPLNAEGNRRIP